MEDKMPDPREQAQPPQEDKPHKVDEKVQEEAAKERSETEGYE